MKLALILVLLLAVVLCIAGSLRKALTVATGYGVYIFLGQLYDYVLWPIVQGCYGLMGVVAMSAGAVATNFIVLHAYQRMGIDWLGIGVLQTLKTRAQHLADRLLLLPSWRGMIAHPPARFLQSLPRLLGCRPLAFVALSTFTDSFLTTAYLRNGHFGPLERRDWWVFIWSSIISCAAWALVNAGVLGVLRKTWGEIQ